MKIVTEIKLNLFKVYSDYLAFCCGHRFSGKGFSSRKPK